MKTFLSLFSLLILATSSYAQLDSVIVEKYYLANSKDAQDVQFIYDAQGDQVTETVVLEEGTITYRVFVVLEPGFKLIKVFADENHPLVVSSTSNFFNNTDRGATLGSNIKKSKFNSALTLPVDSWLTLGMATSSDLGILKSEDPDGSIISGTSGEYLKNNDAQIGIPLNVEDGLMNLTDLPSSWSSNGFNEADSTIFGSLKVGNHFFSNDAYIINSGVSGSSPENNKVLIAQLTTKGDISFEFNIQLQDISKSSAEPLTITARSIAGDEESGILQSRFLTYPRIHECGCNDRSYREFNRKRDCDDPSLCKTKIVFGCTDPNACNYDPSATDFVPGMCCYPGNCGDRDLSKVCPDLKNPTEPTIAMFPNPAMENLTVQISTDTEKNAKIEILSSYGVLKYQRSLEGISGVFNSDFDLKNFEHGMYMVRVIIGDKVENKILIKN
jgi:hypothetical protein